MKVNRNSIDLSFTQMGSGLISADGQTLSWFTVAGVDHKFVQAQAVIKGNKVIVSSTAIQHPVAVRFAWDEAAMPNLCNKEKLPASPFRTDSWK
jgi:sialate O-acetylesterase